MKIAFCTTLNLNASTLVGRILPLAHELSKKHTVHLIHLGESTNDQQPFFHTVGREPFTRTPHGKKRLRGLFLIIALKMIALRTAFTLQRIRPDVIVIAKPLPHNTLGVSLYHFFHRSVKIILDADDFELTANQLTSLAQRAAIHWSERQAAKLSQVIIAASWFIQDHFQQLTNGNKPVTLIPTGLAPALLADLSQLSPPSDQHLLYFGSLSIGSGHRIDLLPEIFKRVHQQYPAAVLTIAGHGDNETELRAAFAAGGLGALIRWTGRFSLADVPELVAQAQIVLDPIDTSITQRAKSSFRVLVAAAAGRPVVTSNIGIRPQFLPLELHERFFAAADNPEDYAEKSIELIKNPLSADNQNTLKKHAAQFSWTKLAHTYITALTL